MSKWQLIKYVYNGRCLLEDNWNLRFITRWVYTLKVIICILLNRKQNHKPSDDYITVGMHSFRKSYSYEYSADDAEFVNITVGYGLFNWSYDEIWDAWL